MNAFDDLRESVAVGDFVQYVLVTDTSVYEVVGKTATGLRLRPAGSGEVLRRTNFDGNPWPVVYTECVPSVEAGTFLVRRRKDGTYRVASWARPLRKAYECEGKPVRVTDYRM